jgi:hypothetical protein
MKKQPMRIVIEVAGGVVNSVYSEGPIPAALDVVVVDIDGLKVGEPVNVESFQIEGLHRAPEAVREALA